MPPVRVKICGVTTPADACLAAQLGADAVGLNFYAPSPRCLDDARAAAILRELPVFVETVGVFVEESAAAMIERARRLGRLHALQLHGAHAESMDTTPYPLIVAAPVKDAASLATLTHYLDRCRAAGQMPAALLVDAHVPGLHGGTGQTAPWDLLADFRPGVPLILAGGLTPDNVAEAIRRVRPYAVDVASGVESSPGCKDAEKMRRFIENAKTVSPGC